MLILQSDLTSQNSFLGDVMHMRNADEGFLSQRMVSVQVTCII